MRKMRKILTVIGDILLTLAGVCGVALLVTRLAGVQFLAVRTGSMGTDYPVGSLVVVRSLEPEQIQTGDVITYVIDETNDTYVTHRVTDIDRENRSFTTKGDANNVTDGSAVAFSQVVGKVVACIPHAGYPMLWLGASGKWILVGVLAVIAFLCVISALHKPKEQEASEGRNESEDKNESEARDESEGQDVPEDRDEP